MLRDRGSASEISIDGEIIIQPDDASADPIRQHIPENIRVDALPPATQKLIADLFEACLTRLERHYPVVSR